MTKVEKNALEWVVFGLSLALVLAVLGSLTYWAVAGTRSPPQLKVEVGQAEQRGEQYYIRVAVRNDGDETAESVKIAVSLRKGNNREEGEFQLDYVPGHSTRDGEVTFDTNPAEADGIVARVAGYQLP